ncbi:MAG: GH116 family glycosyl hydrolase [candidate division KSB1 bacterium]|nr:GH116 family glycosyl hydrolase [candidate division KSB1 bacterium]MDZ7365094.1 GH116 family glycosyl hydrolase [candidate division KSB1 bacterium]MDZ7404304.1 GH116 family glycosyl hydrolase [candidate division KSB1 bacterium]
MIIAASVLAQDHIALKGSVRPHAPISVAGQKSMIAGTENGIFEAWIFPYQICHGFQLFYQNKEAVIPIPLAGLAQDIEVRPEATTITFSHPLFTVRETLLAPVDLPALIVLLEVDSYQDLTLIASFFPAMEPMWPAGLGGQYAFWDDKSQAYVISESRRLRNAFIGAPNARPLSVPLAHELNQSPNQFAFDYKRNNGRTQTFPIIIAADFAQRDSARALYEKLLAGHAGQLEKTRRYYQRLREEFLSIETPEEKLNIAFEWTKVALTKGFINNPDLGAGMVAGFGPSGASQRPGFGWFFGGDCFINSFAMVGYGDFNTARESFRFLQKRQRHDGKMMHELTQAAALIDWFKDFPYGYIHGDTTPYYLVAFWNFLLGSGDLDFLRESWPSLKKAYTWSRSTDTDGDGLMENTKAGLGASELGSLREASGVDIFLASVGVQAWKAMSEMANWMGEKKLSEEASRWHQTGLAALEKKFWNNEKQIYNFSITRQGHPNPEVTAWGAFPMTFRQLDETKTQMMLARLASSEISTDWGCRMLSNKSSAYEPLAYNNGAVWPFLTGYNLWALFNYGCNTAGLQMLRNMAEWTFVDARGFMPEVVSGEYFRPLDTSVPHQLFSSFGYAVGVIRGLLGLEMRSPVSQLAGSPVLRFIPHFPPNWNEVVIKNIRAGKSIFDLHYERNLGGITLTVTRAEGPTCTIEFAPQLEAGVDVKQTASLFLKTEKNAKLQLSVFEGTWLELPREPLQIGQRSQQLRVISERLEEDRFVFVCEGAGGRSYDVIFHSPHEAASVTGGELVSSEKADIIRLKFERAGGEYERREVLINFEK